MRRLDLKEARNKFGRVEPLKGNSSQFKNQRKFPDTKYFCGVSFLHDAQRGEEWAKKIREIINNRGEL